MNTRHVITALFITLVIPLFVSCDDDDDARMPSIRMMTAEEFTRCVDGKAWKHVDSYEIKSNGSISKNSYWDDMTGGAPVHYSFSGNTVTTYMYIDAYPINGYVTRQFTFDSGTNRLMAGQDEVFTVVDVNANELRLIQLEGITGDGKRIYVYSIYRAMTPGEATELKRSYLHNLATLNQDYPSMPEQQQITADDFSAMAVGRTWRCTEAHLVFVGHRYVAADFFATPSGLSPVDYEITADSLYTLTADSITGTVSREAAAYDYRANGFYVETASGTAFHIISLTPDEMHMVQRRHAPVTSTDISLYCIYR